MYVIEQAEYPPSYTNFSHMYDNGSCCTLQSLIARTAALLERLEREHISAMAGDRVVSDAVEKFEEDAVLAG